jgi:hypothetical protein
MDDVAKEVAIEWANKVISSRMDVTAVDCCRYDRNQAWCERQRRLLSSLAVSAAETYLRRINPGRPVQDAPDANVIMMMRRAIAAEIADASSIQAKLDAEILAEVNVS